MSASYHLPCHSRVLKVSGQYDNSLSGLMGGLVAITGRKGSPGKTGPHLLGPVPGTEYWFIGRYSTFGARPSTESFMLAWEPHGLRPTGWF